MIIKYLFAIVLALSTGFLLMNAGIAMDSSKWLVLAAAIAAGLMIMMRKSYRVTLITGVLVLIMGYVTEQMWHLGTLIMMLGVGMVSAGVTELGASFVKKGGYPSRD